MDIGALIFPTDKTIRPDRLGTALEERGYDSLVGCGTYPHSIDAQDAVPSRRRAA